MLWHSVWFTDWPAPHAQKSGTAATSATYTQQAWFTSKLPILVHWLDTNGSYQSQVVSPVGLCPRESRRNFTRFGPYYRLNHLWCTTIANRLCWVHSVWRCRASGTMGLNQWIFNVFVSSQLRYRAIYPESLAYWVSEQKIHHSKRRSWLICFKV